MDTTPIFTPPVKEFTLAEPGVHRAKIVGLRDLGEIQTAFGQKRKIEFGVLLADQFDEDGLPITIRHRVNLCSGPKAGLTEMLIGILGADPGANWDLRQLLGRVVDITVKHSAGADGRIWANITSFSRPRQPQAQPAAPVAAPAATTPVAAPVASAPVAEQPIITPTDPGREARLAAAVAQAKGEAEGLPF